MYDWEGWPEAPSYDQQGVEDVSEDVWFGYQLLSPSPALPARRGQGSVATCWSQGTQSNHRTALTSVWLAWDLFQNIWHLTLTCPVPPLMDFSGVGGHNYRVIWLMHKLCRWWSCLWFAFNAIWWLNKVTVVVDWQHLGQWEIMLPSAFCLYYLHSTVRSACFIKYIGYWGGLSGSEEPVPLQKPKYKLRIFSEMFPQTDGFYVI